MPWRSLPACGSVSAMPERRLPVARSGSHRLRCSGVPNRASISVASECEPRIPATPIHAFEISSKTIEYETASMAMPPYSSGTSIPNRPIAFISSTISSGYWPASSISRATGLMLLRAKSRMRSRNAACCSESSKSIALLTWGLGDPRSLTAAVDHRSPFEGDHLGPILVEAGRAHGDDADVLARARRAHLEHFRARVNRVALEDRIGQPDLVPAEVGHHVLGHVAHALAGHKGEGEAAVDEGLSELGLGRVVVVEVDRRRVLGQEGEPDVVRGRDRAPERVFVDVADLEILEETPPPALLNGHISVVIMRHSTAPPALRATSPQGGGI